jgi:hypothetical protein
VPTVEKLYDELAYIIKRNLKHRIDVVDNNLIYRASINEKDK